MEQYSKCEVLDSHNGVAEGRSLLGCDTVVGWVAPDILIDCKASILDRQVFMEVNGRASNENRKYLCRDNDSMRSGVISAIGDQGSGTKPWTCWQHCASIV